MWTKQDQAAADASPVRRALVFDSAAWREKGDIGDNSLYWKPSTIVRVYWKRSAIDLVQEKLADVTFDYDPDRVSRGHYFDLIKLIDGEPDAPHT